jgi:hypothetical protein
VRCRVCTWRALIVLLIQSVIRPARLRCPGHEDGHLLAEFTWRRRG